MYLLGTDSSNRCNECGMIRHRNYKEANKEKVNMQSAHHKRLKRYGLTPQTYDEMLENQEGKCAICRCIPKVDTKRSLAIDHCHSSGEIRGLLCGNCNTMLGMAKDNIDILMNSMEYLTQ
jgi:hypothetical protein